MGPFNSKEDIRQLKQGTIASDNQLKQYILYCWRYKVCWSADFKMIARNRPLSLRFIAYNLL